MDTKARAESHDIPYDVSAHDAVDVQAVNRSSVMKNLHYMVDEVRFKTVPIAETDKAAVRNIANFIFSENDI